MCNPGELLMLAFQACEARTRRSPCRLAFDVLGSDGFSRAAGLLSAYAQARIAEKMAQRAARFEFIVF